MITAGQTSSQKRNTVCISTKNIGNIKARKEKLNETSSTAPNAYDCSYLSNDYSVEELCPVTGHYSNVLIDYQVFPKVLGSGHYGCVRECIQRSTKKSCAVKSIDKSKISRLDHLRREVNFLSKIKHNRVMKMIDCCEDEEYVHIVTEKYTGGELFDKIIENTTPDGCFSEEKAARIVKSLLEAVAYLHKKNICHRDIKPENILFETEDEDSDIRLIDFGLARKHSMGDAPMANPVGTAYYMSPELLKGKYDRSCDVWSVGVVAYILICGYPPFNGETDPEIYEAIKKARFHFPEKAWTGVSDEAKDFVKSLLRRDPKRRLSAKEALVHPWIVNNVEHEKKFRRRTSIFSKLVRRSYVEPVMI